VRNVVPANWAHLRGLQRCDCSHVAIERYDLNFVSLAIFVDVDNGSNVSCFKTLTRSAVVSTTLSCSLIMKTIPRGDMQ